MTGAAREEVRSEGVPTRRATVRTTHAHAAAVAASLVPDNTDEMRTTVVPAADSGDGGAGRVETVVERETTGGLRTTVDDYVTNLQVADELTTAERTAETTDDQTDDDTNHDDTTQS